MMSELVEALVILGKYTGDMYPTSCEHDILYVHASPEEVSDEDKSRLGQLGFNVDEGRDCFSSIRFGSC